MHCRNVNCFEIVFDKSSHAVDYSVDLTIGNVVGRSDDDVITISSIYRTDPGINMNFVWWCETYDSVSRYFRLS
jgi:hypothetical protein